MISNKYKLSLIIAIFIMSCSFVTDSKDSESTVNPLVGTWNMTTVEYFGETDCSGDPDETLVLDSLEQITEFGLDELQLKLTITLDSYIIGILTTSETGSSIREETISTGIITDHLDQFCVIWDMGDGDNYWGEGGGDGCDACRDYTINGDEFKMTAYNCPIPPFPGENAPCVISTLVIQ